jgi:hypothetical protein
MTEIEDLAEQFETHEKEDEKRFQELGALIRIENAKVLSAITGNETTGGLRSAIDAIRESVPHNARDRLLTLEQRVPLDLPVVLSQLKSAEDRRVSSMRLLWSSVAGLGVAVAGMIISKLLSHPGVTP